MIKYRPEVDGTRALAIVPAVLFHAGVEGFDGGFVGVDIFFVISGYLITTIIITEMAEGRFSLARFFEGRARRILPALFVVLVACVPFVWLWLPSAEIHRFGFSLLSASLFVSDVYFWQSNVDYFTHGAQLIPLRHLWSLSVVEQYYIIYPIFLVLAWRLGTNRILVLLSVVFLVSLGTAVTATQSDSSVVLNGAFYLLPTRGWEILIGVFIAFYLHHNTHLKSHGVNQFLSLIGLGMIIYSFVTFDRQTPIPSLYTLIPTVGAALVIFSAVPTTVVYRLLSVKLVVGIGLISYSAYLWHQPILALARYRVLGELSTSVVLSICFISFLLAWVTWKYVEAPFRNQQNFTSKSIFLIPASGLAALSVVGLMLTLDKGFSGHKEDVITDRLSQIGIENYELDFRTLRSESWVVLRNLYGQDYRVANNPTDRRNNFDPFSNKKRLLIVGNSHSKDMFNIFYSSDELLHHFDVARYGVDLRDIDNSFFASEAYRYSQVVMIATWHKPGDLERLHELSNRIVNDNKQLVIVEESIFFETSGTSTTADVTISRELEEAQQTGADIQADDIVRKVNSVYTDQYERYTSSQTYLEKKRQYDRIAAKIVADHPQVVVLNRLDYICPNHQCHSLTPEGRKTFYDHVHQTAAGATFFAEELLETKFYTDLIDGVGSSNVASVNPSNTLDDAAFNE